MGVAWTSASRFGVIGAQLILTVVLSRLLLPSEFGLVAMVGLLTGFAAILVEFGLGAALVQRGATSSAELSSAFWLSLAGAVVLSATCWLGSPLVADFFRAPRLVGVTRGMAAVFVLAAPGIVPRAILQARFSFAALAQTDLLAALASGAVAVILAINGGGVWSLVAQALVLAGVTSALLFARSGWRPAVSFNRGAARDLSGYSAYLTGFSAVNYWSRHVDDLLIGRWMGPGALGLYDRAYTLMLFPVSHIAGMASSVMLPVLASVKNDHARVRSLYVRATGLIAYAAFPLMAGLAVTARPFVLALFGAAWEAAIPVVRILALVGIIQSVGTTVGWIYTSQARTDIMARWGLVTSATFVCAILIGLRSGNLVAVAWAYLAANAVLMLPGLYLATRLIGLPLGRLLGHLMPALAGAAVMAVAVATVGRLLPSDLAVAWALLVQVAVGIALYVGMAFIFHRPLITEFGRAGGFSRELFTADAPVERQP